MIVRYYIDLSGKKGHRVMAVGGYIASQPQWDAFELEWGAILDDAGADEFHATDFFACERKFKHLKKDSAEHQGLARRFAEAAYRHPAAGFGFGIDLRHFYRDLAVHAYKKIKTPHERMAPAMFLVSQVCSAMAHKHLPPDGPRAVVLVEQGDGVGEIIDWLSHLKQIGEPSMTPYENFAPVPKSERPVQAADLLAHEAWREITEVLKTPARHYDDVRDVMKILATGSSKVFRAEAVKITLTLATQEHFRSTARNLQKFILTRPDYGWSDRELRRQRRRDARRRRRELKKQIVGMLLRNWHRFRRLVGL